MSSLIVLPAGRSFRRTQSQKWVDPQPEKGSIEVHTEEGIVHFVWRNKDTGSADDELLIFPAEASFEQIAQDTSGRSFILKFSSSNQVHFFWLQRAALSDVDARAATDINAIIQDPSYQIGTAAIPSTYRSMLSTPGVTASNLEERSWPPTPGAPRLSHPEPKPRAGPSTIDNGAAEGPLSMRANSDVDTREPTQQDYRNQDMARLLFHWAAADLPIPEDEEASLTDILVPETIAHLIKERPALVDALVPHLPPGLDLPQNVPSSELLLRVVATPQFRDAVDSLETALRNYNLPESMMPWIHLPEDAAWSLSHFLTALREVKSGDDEANLDGTTITHDDAEGTAKDDRMDTD